MTPIIDAQIHAWPRNSPDYPWLDGAVSSQGEKFTWEDALAALDRGKVDRAVLVPPTWTRFDNAYALEGTRRWPGRFAVMGRFDLDGANREERIATWLRRPGMLGIRAVFRGDAWIAMLKDPRAAFWAQCSEAGIPFMCFVPRSAAPLGALGAIAAAHPKLTLIVDHAGCDPHAADWWGAIGDLLDLARYPNLAVKVSSLPCFSRSPYPFADIHGHIRSIFEKFGAERMMWGSDASRLPCPYEDNVALFQKELAFLSASDLDWIMGQSLAARLNWPANATDAK